MSGVATPERLSEEFNVETLTCRGKGSCSQPRRFFLLTAVIEKVEKSWLKRPKPHCQRHELEGVSPGFSVSLDFVSAVNV